MVGRPLWLIPKMTPKLEIPLKKWKLVFFSKFGRRGALGLACLLGRNRQGWILSHSFLMLFMLSFSLASRLPQSTFTSDQHQAFIVALYAWTLQHLSFFKL